MQTQPCRPRPLATSAACDLWMCADCGTINLSIGPVSMRLKPEHFKDITATMQEAVHALVHIQPDQTSLVQQSSKINH